MIFIQLITTATSAQLSPIFICPIKLTKSYNNYLILIINTWSFYLFFNYLLNKEGSKWLTSHITNISKYKKKLTITNITNISTDQVVIEFAVSQMRLQLTKSVIFAGVCCFVSQLSTFHSEHYLLFSCKEKVNIWGKRKIFP